MSLHSRFMPVMVHVPNFYETAALEKNSRSFKLIIVVQSLSRVWLYDPMGCSTPGFLSMSNSQSLLKLMFISSVMPSNHLILCHPFLLAPSIFPSIRVFSKKTVLHIRWPKYWSFNYSISTSNEYLSWFPLGLTGLISLQSKGLSRVFSNTTVQKH